MRVRTRPVADRFSRCGRRRCRAAFAARLLDDGPSGTTTYRVVFPLGLSSMPALPVLRAKPPGLGLRGFAPRKQSERSASTFVSASRSRADHRRTPFRSFGALRNPPACATGAIMIEGRRCRIEERDFVRGSLIWRGYFGAECRIDGGWARLWRSSAPARGGSGKVFMTST